MGAHEDLVRVGEALARRAAEAIDAESALAQPGAFARAAQRAVEAKHAFEAARLAEVERVDEEPLKRALLNFASRQGWQFGDDEAVEVLAAAGVALATADQEIEAARGLRLAYGVLRNLAEKLMADFEGAGTDTSIRLAARIQLELENADEWYPAGKPQQGSEVAG